MKQRIKKIKENKYVTRRFLIFTIIILTLLLEVPLITFIFLNDVFGNQIRYETTQISHSIQLTIKAFINGAYNLSYEQFIGIYGVDIRLNYLQHLVEQYNDNIKGRLSLVVDGGGVVIAHPYIEYMQTITNYKTQTRRLPQLNEDGTSLLNHDGNPITYEEYQKLINKIENT